MRGTGRRRAGWSVPTTAAGGTAPPPRFRPPPRPAGTLPGDPRGPPGPPRSSRGTPRTDGPATRGTTSPPLWPRPCGSVPAHSWRPSPRAGRQEPSQRGPSWPVTPPPGRPVGPRPGQVNLFAPALYGHFVHVRGRYTLVTE